MLPTIITADDLKLVIENPHEALQAMTLEELWLSLSQERTSPMIDAFIEHFISCEACDERMHEAGFEFVEDSSRDGFAQARAAADRFITGLPCRERALS